MSEKPHINNEKSVENSEINRTKARYNGRNILRTMNYNTRWRRTSKTQKYSDILPTEPDNPRDAAFNGVLKNIVDSILIKYEEELSSRPSDFLSFSTVSAIESGYLAYSISDLLARGVRNRNESRTRRRLGLNISGFELDDETREDLIRNAESDIELEIRRMASRQVDQIPQEQIKQAIYVGSLMALRNGARIDEGGNVIYSISAMDGKATRNFMEKAGINFDGHECDDESHQCFYAGFANILNIIKDRSPEETRRGFEALDWYYDNFKCADHLDDFIKTMEDFGTVNDESWSDKYEEYASRHNEICEFEKHNQNRDAAFQSIEKIAVGDVKDRIEKLQEKMREFPPIEVIQGPFNKLRRESAVTGPGRGRKKSGGNNGKSNGEKTKEISEEDYLDFDLKKAEKFFEKLEWFQMIDEGWIKENGEKETGFGIYNAKFNEKNGKLSKYLIVNFVYNKHNIAVAAPIAKKSNDSAYVWVGSLSEGKFAWREHFSGIDNDKSVSEGHSREGNSIRAHSHRANKTFSFDPLDNLWYNICMDIEARTSLPE